jgi:hypothetical protein
MQPHGTAYQSPHAPPWIRWSSSHVWKCTKLCSNRLRRTSRLRGAGRLRHTNRIRGAGRLRHTNRIRGAGRLRRTSRLWPSSTSRISCHEESLSPKSQDCIRQESTGYQNLQEVISEGGRLCLQQGLINSLENAPLVLFKSNNNEVRRELAHAPWHEVGRECCFHRRAEGMLLGCKIQLPTVWSKQPYAL